MEIMVIPYYGFLYHQPLLSKLEVEWVWWQFRDPEALDTPDSPKHTRKP